MTNWPKIHLNEARGAWWRQRYNFRRKKFLEYDGDVHRSIKFRHPVARERAEVLRSKWAKLMGEAAREVHRYAEAVARERPKESDGIPWTGEGTCVPKTVWNPYRRKIANWIARELRDAWQIEQGWYVTSGVRTDAEQAVLYHRYRYEGGNIAAPPGVSNHRGWDYAEPRWSGGSQGAVDAEPAERLDAALRRKRYRRLYWAEETGLADHPHFSATGH